MRCWGLLVVGALLAGCGGAAEQPADPFGPLAALAVERIRTGDQVAAAKFGTRSPIDDPGRERQVLDAVTQAAPGLGLDQAESQRFFADQIEASKVVQRGLHQEWAAHPEQRPATRPDLAKDVRPVLDRLTPELLATLRATTAARHDGGQCGVLAARAVEGAGRPLDELHRAALTVAFRSVCPGTPKETG